MFLEDNHQAPSCNASVLPISQPVSVAIKQKGVQTINMYSGN